MFAPERSRWVPPALAVLLLLAHFALGLTGKREWSTTSDELAHLTAGHAYWEFNDYRLQPENGNLPQRWAGLPAFLRGDRLPPLDHPEWKLSDVWVLGHVYFYQLGNDLERLLLAARAMALVWSVALGLLIYLWSRRLFGDGGGLVSLAFYCLDPGFLAHGALVTSDVCMAFFMLAALGAWWRHLDRLDWRTGAVSALVFAVACVAKYSAAALIPMFLLLAAGRRIRGPLPGPRGALLFSMLAHAAAALVVIWAFFGFRYAAAAPGMPEKLQFITSWDRIMAEIGWQGKVLGWLRDRHALPEAFLFGYNHVIAYGRQRASFLDGDYSITGWVRFFPLAFLYKTPTPFLIALPLLGGIAFTQWRKGRDRARAVLERGAPLIVLFVVYWAASLASHLNIGHRHILPTYPVLYIGAGALAGVQWSTRRVRAAIAAVLLTWSAVEVARIHPHELAYFNELAGGPRNGWRHLVDSSLDWGQDLPGLKKWLDQNAGGQPVFLSYFGCGEPAYYGIAATRLPFLNGFHMDQPWYRPRGGWYAISATMLQCVYLPRQGAWTLEAEAEYERLRAAEPLFEAYAKDPDRRAELAKEIGANKWRSLWNQYDSLRFVRLCHVLRVRQPEATIGYSIFIYKLTDLEVAQATAGTVHEWRKLIEDSVGGKR